MSFRHSDDFGDRMKAYEAAETDRKFDPSLPLYARIDGRSFSVFTRDFERPFDQRMADAMVAVTKTMVEKTHALIGYVQSDEISLAWLCDKPESQPLFGGKVHKLTSVLASLAAASFAVEVMRTFPNGSDLVNRLPHFDCRVFQLPSQVEVANAFLWRAMDARKNAVSSACRAIYSPKQMHLADQVRMREMIKEKGIDFESYPSAFKWGTFVQRRVQERALTPQERARIPVKYRPPVDQRVIRASIEEIPTPEFRLVKNRVGMIFSSEMPEV